MLVFMMHSKFKVVEVWFFRFAINAAMECILGEQRPRGLKQTARFVQICGCAKHGTQTLVETRRFTG
jgi:hypothetical protein